MVSIKDLVNTIVLSKRLFNFLHLTRDLKFDLHGMLGSNHEELLKMGCIAIENDDEYLKYRPSDACKDEFVKRVNQFIKSFKGIVIDSFMVEFGVNYEQSNNIDDWIRFAILRGVQRINFACKILKTQELGVHKVTCYKFPFGLSFECKNSTLKHMTLAFCLVYDPTTSFDIFPFTNLRSLVLKHSKVNVNLLATLLSNCLLLEKLNLIYCQLSSSTLKIASLSLCHFNLDCCYDSEYEYLEFISLDCPKLTSFHYQHNICSMSMNTPILKTIYIYYFGCFPSKAIVEAFAIFSTVPKLEILNLDILNCSYNINDGKLQSFQALKNLRELNLRVDAKQDFDMWWIFSILQASPFLQKLSVMEEDYISELPDCILSYIQSMISMKDMMNTSVLSKRWGKLWHLRRDLKFEGHNVLESKENVRRNEFVKRVDQFVKNYKGTKIDSFVVYFSLNHKQSNNIDEWIRFAVARGVGRIDLLFFYYNDASYKFPFGLSFECKNSALKHMTQASCLVYHPTTSFDIFPFTNLRSLVLICSKVDVNLLATLLSNCLLLEKLNLIYCQLSSSTLKIASSCLCHFKLHWCLYIGSEEDLELISLDCPKLTFFYYMPIECSARMSMNTPILNTIHYFGCLSSEAIVKAFAIFASAPKLEILNLDIRCHFFDIKDEELQSIQTLATLKELQLTVCAKQDFDMWWIFPILQASPFLQKLSVMIIRPKFYANQRDIRDLIMFSHNEIKVVELRGCVGNWYEIEFVMNSLKYIHKLEQIVLSPHWIDEDFGINNGSHSNQTWCLNGRELILQKLQAEGIELDKLVLK